MSEGEVARVELVATGWDTPLRVVRAAVETPAPGPGQVTVAVEACGVCHRDLIDRAGRIPYMRLPVVPGHEACGRVVAVGEGVTDWSVGDRVATMHRDACGVCPACVRGDTSLCVGAFHVLGLLQDGGYARWLTGPQSLFFRLPDGLPAAEAAVLHCTFGTAWRSMVTVGGLKAGETVLITGANGGVGSAAVQIAARFASEVIAVVRDPSHVDWLRQLGATQVVVCADGNLHKLGLPPVDLALDNVGAATFNGALRCLTVGGRVAVVGNVDDRRVELNLGLLVVKGLRVLGAGGATRSDMAAVLAAHAERPFQVVIDRTLPLADADAAQQVVRAGGLRGRVVVVP